MNIKKIYWRIRIFFLALKWIPRINLGDLVWYKGSKYCVYNGNRSGMWRLLDLADNKDTFNTGWVLRLECKKVWSIKNINHSFQSGWRFYMTSWFSIWSR